MSVSTTVKFKKDTDENIGHRSPSKENSKGGNSTNKTNSNHLAFNLNSQDYPYNTLSKDKESTLMYEDSDSEANDKQVKKNIFLTKENETKATHLLNDINVIIN
jgi:hypothetical protein